MSAPYTINDPDFGVITVVSEYEWQGKSFKLFINSLGFLVASFWGVDKGQPVRFKIAGPKIAADFPGVNSNSYVTDGNGSITNG